MLRQVLWGWRNSTEAEHVSDAVLGPSDKGIANGSEPLLHHARQREVWACVAMTMAAAVEARVW